MLVARLPHKFNPRTVFPVVVAGAALLLAACSGTGPEAALANPSGEEATGVTSREPTPTPAVTLATPTPTQPELPPDVSPLVSHVDAERAVLEAIATCTDGVTQGGGQLVGLRMFFDSEFSPASRAWLIEANTSDFAVTFGHWRVNEGDRLAARPDDRVAEQIASGLVECTFPTVLLDADPAPPRFLTLQEVAIPEEIPEEPATEEEQPTPPDIISSADLAAVRVWSGVYSCSQDFPSLASFTARPDVGGLWLVEGRTEVTSYGLWEVEAATGNVQARDERARQVEASCGASPVTLTGEQAAVRVWVATYDCFGEPPPLFAFTSAQETPHRWVVEGRASVIDIETGATIGTVLYGLWLVETDTGSITGLDAMARNLRSLECFQPFL